MLCVLYWGLNILILLSIGKKKIDWLCLVLRPARKYFIHMEMTPSESVLLANGLRAGRGELYLSTSSPEQKKRLDGAVG